MKGGDGRGRDRAEKERMHREVGRIGEGGDKGGGIQEGKGRGYLGGEGEGVCRSIEGAILLTQKVTYIPLNGEGGC